LISVEETLIRRHCVLGLLFFIWYINDAVEVVVGCQIYFFVDDTLLSKLNRDLENLSKWLKFNKLKLNVNKTKDMLVSGRTTTADAETTNLHIDGDQIERVKTIKNL
jgi:hypothetical protein